MHKKFRIYNYGIDIKTVYSRLGVNLLSLPHKSHRMVDEIRKLLIAYLREEVNKGHYPTRREIKNKFGLDLSPVLFKGIEDFYKKASIPYRQVENQEIKIDKAKKFLKVVLGILERMELSVLKVSEPNQPGIDIIVDASDGKVGIELKAYNKFERIKRKDILQLNKFLASEKLRKIFLFTTTNRISTDFPSWIKIFTFQRLKKYCNEDEIRILNEIREKSVHVESKNKEEKRQKILKYIRENAKKEKYVGADDILRDLKLCVYTYFKGMDEVYEKAGIKVPLKRSRYFRNKELKEKVRKEFLDEIFGFIKNEVAKGHYPSGVDISKMLGVKNIWNYWKVSDLYKTLNLPTYLERVKNKSFNPFRGC